MPRARRERVLVLLSMIARGRASVLASGQMQRKRANLLYVREGKVTMLVHYWESERAPADPGLE